MRILIAGSTGFLGERLVRHLRDAGHEVSRLVRREPRKAARVPLGSGRRDPRSGHSGGCDAVVNLAGATSSGRGLEAYKRSSSTAGSTPRGPSPTAIAALPGNRARDLAQRVRRRLVRRHRRPGRRRGPRRWRRGSWPTCAAHGRARPGPPRTPVYGSRSCAPASRCRVTAASSSRSCCSSGCSPVGGWRAAGSGCRGSGWPTGSAASRVLRHDDMAGPGQHGRPESGHATRSSPRRSAGCCTGRA